VQPTIEPVVLLQPSGYARLRAGDAYLLCDCAPVGPDYLPGHGHADTLSFELSLFGQRVLVNSGTSRYGVGPERLRQRGTPAHNTVVVDGADSSEVWSGFRVARRAHARVHELQQEGPLVLAASHDGYRRLAGRNEHWRRWTLDADGLRIEDRVSGACREVEAFFHLHPQVTATSSAARQLTLSAPGMRAVRMELDDAADVQIRSGTWHPQFGLTVPNQCIAVRFAGASLTTRISWS
jgi:uncharacterized heparinase superfamily protein